jgi:predicted nucleic acid-binding Zn ribbon protein
MAEDKRGAVDLVRCLYCGRDIPDDYPSCPHCGAPSHYQKRGRLGVRRKFIIYFIALTIFVLVVAFLAPR